MRAHILTVLTLANSLLFTGTIVLVLSGYPFRARTASFLYVFVSAVLLNAVLFLYYTRHRRLNTGLTEKQKNRWEIAMFLASPVSLPIYLFRHVRTEGTQPN